MPPIFLAQLHPELLENPETRLKDIACFLLTPIEPGIFLSRENIAQLGRATHLPHGFGDRAQSLARRRRTRWRTQEAIRVAQTVPARLPILRAHTPYHAPTSSGGYRLHLPFHAPLAGFCFRVAFRKSQSTGIYGSDVGELLKVQRRRLNQLS